MARGKGNYYKMRTKKWFIGLGYQCGYCEQNVRIFSPKTKQVFFIKKDLFGADGISLGYNTIIFWNSKLGKKNVAAAIKEFAKYPFPQWVKRWVVVWEKRAREPEIVKVEEVSNG